MIAATELAQFATYANTGQVSRNNDGAVLPCSRPIRVGLADNNEERAIGMGSTGDKPFVSVDDIGVTVVSLSHHATLCPVPP